jgi:alpha-galactosidase
VFFAILKTAFGCNIFKTKNKALNIMTETLRLENDLFLREIVLGAGGVYTSSIYNKVTKREYNIRDEAGEFNFSVNGDQIGSYSKPEVHILDGSVVDIKQILEPIGHEFSAGSKGSQILKVSLRCEKHDFILRVCYEIYPDLAGCGKWLEIDCLGEDLHIGKMFFERLHTCPGEYADSDFFGQQGMVAKPPMFAACGDDDIIQLHNAKLNEGMFIANGACGPLRYFMVYPHWGHGIACGYSMSAADFNKFMKKGEKFVSDKAYSLLYKGERQNPAAANAFREMIRRDLPDCPDNGRVMYCTWLPFLKNINEELLLKLVDRAAEFGFNHFVVDDGWFTDNNWEVDHEKFPDGLEVIAKKVHAAGMKFGLWLNIGNDYGQADSRPEDNASDFHGIVKPFGFSTRGLKTRCFASKHRDLMAVKLKELAKQYGVDYFKLDFSNILSPYGMMPYGCHSHDHVYHKDYSDAVFEQYQSMMNMRETVKKSFPDLIIDFSFEVFGTERPSIAALRYSELHHASNMNTLHPKFTRADHIRRTLYEYGNILPNERLLGSLICLQNENDVENLLTAFVGTPLVAGDLTKISPKNAELLKNIVKNLNALVEESPLSEYELLRYKAAGETEQWDGFARYTKSGRGMICVFRNDYPKSIVKVVLSDFPDGEFTLTDMATGELIKKSSGKELRAGFELAWEAGTSCRAIVIE